MGAATGTYRFMDHLADVGIEAQSTSLEGLFDILARALMEWIGPSPGEEAPESVIAVKLEAEGHGELVVQWLQEMLYLFHQGHFYPVRVLELQVRSSSLEARLLGRLWGEDSAGSYREVKAVTYHQLCVEQSGALWQARVILDV